MSNILVILSIVFIFSSCNKSGSDNGNSQAVQPTAQGSQVPTVPGGGDSAVNGYNIPYQGYPYQNQYINQLFAQRWVYQDQIGVHHVLLTQTSLVHTTYCYNGGTQVQVNVPIYIYQGYFLVRTAVQQYFSSTCYINYNIGQLPYSFNGNQFYFNGFYLYPGR